MAVYVADSISTLGTQFWVSLAPAFSSRLYTGAKSFVALGSSVTTSWQGAVHGRATVRATSGLHVWNMRWRGDCLRAKYMRRHGWSVSVDAQMSSESQRKGWNLTLFVGSCCSNQLPVQCSCSADCSTWANSTNQANKHRTKATIFIRDKISCFNFGTVIAVSWFIVYF